MSAYVLKVCAPGRLLLLDLHAPVDYARAAGVLSAEELCVTVPKARPRDARALLCSLFAQAERGLWLRLTAVGDKAALLARRQRSLAEKVARLPGAAAAAG